MPDTVLGGMYGWIVSRMTVQPHPQIFNMLDQRRQGFSDHDARTMIDEQPYPDWLRIVKMDFLTWKLKI
jgi:hypothetical protein